MNCQASKQLDASNYKCDSGFFPHQNSILPRKIILLAYCTILEIFRKTLKFPGCWLIPNGKPVPVWFASFTPNSELSPIPDAPKWLLRLTLPVWRRLKLWMAWARLLLLWLRFNRFQMISQKIFVQRQWHIIAIGASCAKPDDYHHQTVLAFICHSQIFRWHWFVSARTVF